MAYTPRSGWSEGTVVGHTDGSPHYYDVMPDGGDGMLRAIPRVLINPGDSDVLPLHTRVLLCYLLPRGPYIHGVIPTPAASGQFTITEAGPDSLPGDRLMRSPDGNFVAAFVGGMSALGSGGMAQVRTHANGHVDVLSETYTHHTAGSETKITRTEGETNIAVRVGASAAENAGPGTQDAWQLRIDAGSTGDLLRVSVTAPNGQELGHLHMSAGGRISLYASDGRIDHTEGDVATVAVGNAARHVTEGDSLSVDGKRSEAYGSLSHAVTGAESYSVGAARLTSVGANDMTVVSGDQVTQVSGNTLHTLISDFQQVVAPLYDARTPLASGLASASWVNYTGGFNFVLQPTAAGNSFSVVSSLPGSVNLGVDGAAVYNPATGKHEIVAGPGVCAVTMHEPLVTWLGQLLSWLDKHEHATSVGPTTRPVLPATPILSPTTSTFGSLRVRVGR